MTTAGCPAWRASRCARAAVPARAFGTSAAARASATPSSEEPEIAFDPRVDTYTERRRAWESQLNALRKEWAADFKARADAKAAEVQSERARIEEAKAARKAAKALKSAARAEEVAREEKARARQGDGAAAARRRARATRLCRAPSQDGARGGAAESLAELGHRGGPGRAHSARAGEPEADVLMQFEW